MKANPIFKILAIALSLMMLFSVIPMGVFAATPSYAEEADDYYKVVSKKYWELAPGIIESEIIINNDTGDRRQVAHVVEVDINNEYTKVIPSYKGMTPTPGSYGVQVMSKQVAFAEANGYGNVVAAMNISLSWYDSAYYDAYPELVGEPLGYMILDGVQYTNSQGKTAGAQTCLVINFDEKDGVARPSDIPKVVVRSTKDAITGWEEQVIPANFGFIVKDGKKVHTTENHTAEGAPRSMLGVKADGSIVMVMNDGRQAPYSTGFNDYEMSEFMLKLGCVYAINGDGGGSSQFLSQRPGEELALHCLPSDGSPRATTHGVLVISTAPSTGEFVRAHVETDNVYYTPFSSVQFKATGADLAGGAAEIPADAVWKLSDASFGSIDENGLFVSNGKTGEVEAQLVYNGEIKGSSSINIVIPDSIAFGTAQAYTVPFGESVNLKVTAKYGVFDVTLKPSDYTITFGDNTLGSLVGNEYTAGNTRGSTTMTVTLTADTSIFKTIPFRIDKGSQVIFDFERGTESANLNNWVIKGHTAAANISDISIVDKTTGMVHDGENALAFHFPMMNAIDGSEDYDANSITWVGDPVLLENATAIGLWIYIPEEATQTEIALNYVWYNDKGVQQRTTPDLCLNDDFNGMQSSGWHYLSVPVSNSIAYIENATSVAASQGFKRNFFLKFYLTNSGNAGDESSYMGDITYYIDNVTVDYSDAVSDRIKPSFNAAYVKNISIDTEALLEEGKTISTSNNIMNFMATASDNIEIDADTAAVSVDGKSINASFMNGKITTSDVTLGAGIHRIVFEIADTTGNIERIVRYISVAGSDVAVNVVPRNPEKTTALTGSVYWVDVVAKNAESVDKVTLKLDLDSMHSWQLDYAELAYNYDVEYFFASPAEKDDNIITVILTNKGSDISGNAVLASLPIRLWSSTAAAWKAGDITAVSVNVEVELGEVVYNNNISATFSAKKIHVDTEAYIHYYKMDKTYFANNTFHQHTTVALKDLAATCTKPGYTGRTFCEVCDSVVDWGTTIPALGHNWTINAEGKLACANTGKLFNGIYTDGKEYIDGVVILDGWFEINGVKAYYYKDGVKLTGSHFIDGVMYTFSDKGDYLADYKYNGFYEINDTVMYFENNEFVTGLQWIESTLSYYNFDKNGMAFDGEMELCGAKCLFENGKFIEGEGVAFAGACGTDAHYVIFKSGTMKIDGNGETADFLSGPMVAWRNYRQYMKTVIIGKNITKIGSLSFSNAYATEEIIFEEGSKLVEISVRAFSMLYKLESIELPSSLEKISPYTFYDCPALKAITFAEGSALTEIGKAALGNTGLETITLPASLEILGEYALYENASLKTVLFEDGSKLTTIGRYAFRNDKALEYVYIPNSVTSIDTGAFSGCSNVELSVADGSYALEYAIGKGIKYTTREVAPFVKYEGACGDNAKWELYNTGVLKITGSGAMTDFEAGKTPWYKYKAEIVAVEIGKDITSIGAYSFYSCEALKTVTFAEGSSLKTINKSAFGLTGIETITIPASVESLADYALFNNASLKTVLFEDGSKLATIGRYVFRNDKALESVYIPNGVTSIDTSAFSGCSNVELSVAEGSYGLEYAIGKGIKYTTREVAPFVKYEGTCGVNAKWELYNNGVLKITGSGAMTDYAALSAPWYKYRAEIVAVEISKDITVIGSFSFYGCANLKTVTFAENGSLVAINKGAFGLTGLETITIPASVETIVEYAFYDNASLKTVLFEDGSKLISIGRYAFKGDKALETVFIPDAVSSINETAFSGATNVKLSVAEGSYALEFAIAKHIAHTIREVVPFVKYEGSCGANVKWELYNTGVLKITGSGAMTDYESGKAPWYAYRAEIVAVEISKDITVIGSFSFYRCLNLKTVTFAGNGSLKTINKGAFGYTGIEEIVIPASVTKLDRYAFYYSEQMHTVTFAEGSQLQLIDAYAFRGTIALNAVNGVPEDADVSPYAFYQSAFIKA